MMVTIAGAAEGVTRQRVVRDYRGLAEQLQAAVRPGDVIVVPDVWYDTPFHYYLRSPSYRLVPPDSLPAVRPSRVWIVTIGDDDKIHHDAVSIAQARLPGLVEVQQLRAYHTGATLFTVRPDSGATKP